MMSLYIYQFLYISFLASFLHFAYDMSNHLFIFSIIGAVNECVWEHLKLGIFPWFSWFLIRWYCFPYENSYIGNLTAVLSYMFIILFIFYGSVLVFKKHYLPLSISSFYIGVIFGSIMEHLIKSYEFSESFEKMSLICCIIIFCYGMISSYYPIKCFLMLDSKYQLYGMEAHKKRCHITKRKKHIVFIFNLLGIALPKDEEKSK